MTRGSLRFSASVSRDQAEGWSGIHPASAAMCLPASLLRVFGLAALLSACSGELVCTEEQRVAVRVHVSSPVGLAVDGVTAEHDHEMPCGASSVESDASPTGVFRCLEQGGGRYTIRVYSGDLCWTAHVKVAANECHTTEIANVAIVMDPDTAVDESQGEPAHGL